MEMLVVVVIIGVLAGLLFPAINAARESSRRAACQNNLKQFFTGMLSHSQLHQQFCSGAMDWNQDGCVTEVGWVADLVRMGTPVGQMLCPSNNARITEAYLQLLQTPVADLSPCVDHLGSAPRELPDGSLVSNPCRQIIESNLDPGDPARTQLVEQQIHNKFFNTNYTASWFLVRGAVKLDPNGNLANGGAGCSASLAAVASTLGPLRPVQIDSSNVPAMLIPLLACGAPVGQLSEAFATYQPGALVTKAFTNGPVQNPSMEPLPPFPAGTPRTGPDGWWAGWNTTWQDYRGFAPVHRGACNVLFADGSVRPVEDRNKDGLLNNGFTANGSNGFANDEVEWTEQEVFSGWSLTEGY